MNKRDADETSVTLTETDILRDEVSRRMVLVDAYLAHLAAWREQRYQEELGTKKNVSHYGSYDEKI